MRNEVGLKFQTVIHKIENADFEGVVATWNDVETVDGKAVSVISDGDGNPTQQITDLGSNATCIMQPVPLEDAISMHPIQIGRMTGNSR